MSDPAPEPQPEPEPQEQSGYPDCYDPGGPPDAEGYEVDAAGTYTG